MSLAGTELVGVHSDLVEEHDVDRESIGEHIVNGGRLTSDLMGPYCREIEELQCVF